MYGKELILDVHECDTTKFNRKSLKAYFVRLCKLIDMEPCKLIWWDDHGVPQDEQQTEPHLKGTTAIQFIMTSNITIHTLDLMGNVYVNIFSCKYFNSNLAKKYTVSFFGGKLAQSLTIDRL